MIRLPGRTVDLRDPEQIRGLGLPELARKLEDPGYLGFLARVQEAYKEAGEPLVLSEGSLRNLLLALDALWEGREPDLGVLQPSLRERVVKPFMDSATTRNWAKAFTERVAREFVASVGPVPAEGKAKLERYAEDLWREVEKALESTIILYQDESGQVHRNREDLIKRIVHNAHARLSAQLRLELLRL